MLAVSVNASSRKERLKALGQEIVDLGLVPEVDWQSQDAPFREDLETSDVLAGVIDVTCQWWDTLMERVQSESARVSDMSHVGRGFLRFVTVDVSLRMLGWARLAGMELPEPHVPVWARPNGVGEILRGLQRDAELSRHQLARRLEVSPTTVDNWLDGRNLPTRYYLPALAQALSGGQTIRAGELERRLRREFALAGLAGVAAAVVGWDEVAADVEAGFLFTRLMQEFDELTPLLEELASDDRFAELGGEDKAGRLAGFLLPLLLLTGSAGPFRIRLLRSLAQRPEVRDWADDIYAVTLSIELQLRHIVTTQPGGRMAAGLAQDYFDVVGEPTPEDLEADDAIRTTLLGEQDDIFPFRMESGVVPHPFSLIDRSIRLRRGLVRRFPQSADAHYQPGSMLGMMGRRVRNREWVDEGIMECRVAAGLEPRWDGPAVEPGIILCNIEDWDGALRELETAEGSLPAVTPHLRNVRGYALMNAGRLEEALAEYLAVVAVRPDFATAWGYAAHCAFSLGNRTEGLRYAKRARALGDPETYHAWDNGAYGPRRKSGSS